MSFNKLLLVHVDPRTLSNKLLFDPRPKYDKHMHNDLIVYLYFSTSWIHVHLHFRIGAWGRHIHI
jgi:hypothetical protein